MSWQKCPICNGTGNNPAFDGNIYLNTTCRTCKGKGIINELTGLPPKVEIQKLGNIELKELENLKNK